MNKQYCVHCGQELSDDARFCTHCGTNVIPSSDYVDDTVDPSYYDDPSNAAEDEDNNSKTTLIIVIVCSALLLLAILVGITCMAFFFFNNKGNNDEVVVSSEIITEEDTLLENDEEENSSITGEPSVSTVTGTAVDISNASSSTQNNASSDSEYVLPNSDTMFLAAEDIDHLSAEDLRIARNEIYARHGRIFESEDLREHFLSTSWYEETTTTVSDSDLNEYELSNIQLILALENHYGETDADWYCGAYTRVFSVSNGILTLEEDASYEYASETTYEERMAADNASGVRYTYCIATDCVYEYRIVGNSQGTTNLLSTTTYSSMRQSILTERSNYLSGGFCSNPSLYIEMEDGIVIRIYTVSS